MFTKWGRFAYRHRRVIPLVVVALILILQVCFGSKLGERLSQEGWEDPGADSTAAAAIEQDTFGRDNSGDVIVLVDAPEGVDTQALVASMNSQLGGLRDQFPNEIASVNSYFEHPNPQQVNAEHTKAFAAIGLKGDGEQTLKDFRTIKPALDALEAPGGTVQPPSGSVPVAATR